MVQGTVVMVQRRRCSGGCFGRRGGGGGFWCPGPGKHPAKQWDTHHYEWIQAKTPGGEASNFTGCSRCRLGTSAGAFANGACISEWTADVYEREANSSGGLPSSPGEVLSCLPAVLPRVRGQKRGWRCHVLLACSTSA